MAKSKQNNHEYYANAETCRNRLFDTYNPSHLQNEDYHLNYYNEEDSNCQGRFSTTVSLS